MIRDLITASLHTKALRAQGIGRPISLSSCWPGRFRVESTGKKNLSSSLQQGSVHQKQQCWQKIVCRMYSYDPDYNKYARNPFSSPYEEGYIEGPMLPKTPLKKKKKKKKKPEKPIPILDSKEQALEKMRIRFDEIEKEHLGPNRGIRTVKWIAGKKCEGLHRSVTTKMANSILNSWIYCRHALQHGHYQLNDMTKVELAESLLGKGTKTKVADRDARLILKELFRFGKSGVFDHYMKMHNEKMKLMGKAAIATERNRLGVPKIRNLATIEEMTRHGYTEIEIDEELRSRAKKELNRHNKKLRREAPAYLRHEVSGARRQEARKIKRILLRKERKRLLRQRERELQLGIPSEGVRGTEDTDNEDGDGDDDDDDDHSSDDDFSSSDDDFSSSDDDDEETDRESDGGSTGGDEQNKDDGIAKQSDN